MNVHVCFLLLAAGRQNDQACLTDKKTATGDARGLGRLFDGIKSHGGGVLPVAWTSMEKLAYLPTGALREGKAELPLSAAMLYLVMLETTKTVLE